MSAQFLGSSGSGMLSPTAYSTDGRLHIYTVIYGGRVSANRQVALCTDLRLNLEERKEVERTKVGSQCEKAQHISITWSSEDKRGDLLCGTVVIWAMQVHNKQKASQFEVTAPLNHRKDFSPCMRLIGGTTLHLIRCVRKVKLAKIISQLFCLLRRKNYSFKCVTVLLRMHMQTHTKRPAWGFWSFSVLISLLHYFSGDAAEHREIKTNSHTGKSRKKELLTL